MISFHQIIIRLIVILFFIGIVSCEKKQEKADATTIIECLNCSEEISFSLGRNDLFEKVEYVQLETTNECLIKEIDFMLIADTSIFVVDDNSVYRFSKMDGKFLNKIGGKGPGPGEYIGVKNLFVDSEQNIIFLLDLVQSKRIKYDFDGNYISSHKIGRNTNMTNTALYLAGDNILYHNDISPFSESAYSFYEKSTDSVIELLSYGEFKLKKYSLGFSKHPMTYSNNGIHCIMPYDNKIYIFDSKDAHIKAKYSVEYSGKPTNMRMAVQEDPPMFITRQLMARDNYFPGYTAIFQTANTLVLNTFNNNAQPAFFYTDIDSLKGSYYSYSLTPDESEPIFEIFNVSENQFISKLNSSQLYKWKEHYKDLNKIPDQRLRDIIANSNDDNNPCLVIYHVQHRDLICNLLDDAHHPSLR